MPGVSRLSARLKAPTKSAVPAGGGMAASASVKDRESSLADSSTRGWAEATTTLACPPAGSCLRSAWARARAAPIRSGFPSPAAIDPESSTMNTVCRASGAAVRPTGRATANASSSTASSCRSSRTDGRNRCHGEAAETGSDNGFHRYVDPTTTSGRRGLRMCRRMIGTARASSNNPAGAVKLIAADPERKTLGFRG
jgi:hypothetical protein